MESVDNPYRAPQVGPAMPAATSAPMPPPQPPGLVSHVRIVAVLMMVQGVLAACFGLFYCSIGFVIPVFMEVAGRKDPNFNAGNDQKMVWLFTALYVALGAPTMAAGILGIVAGIKGYGFRGRTLSIAALVTGIISIATCYCGPTAIALAVYGLIVLLNQEVTQAFQMRQQGYSSEQVLATFSPYPRYYPPAGQPAGPAGVNPFRDPSEPA